MTYVAYQTANGLCDGSRREIVRIIEISKISGKNLFFLFRDIIDQQLVQQNMSSWFTEHMFGAKSSSQNTTNTNTMHEQTVGDDPGDQTESDGIPLPLPAEDQTSALSSLSAPPASETTNYEQREIVAEWRVPLHGKLYQIEFEHGTTSGRRVLWINNKESFRRDWMFKLVGDDSFKLENIHCILRVDPAPGFSYKYSLFVDGKPFEQFRHSQAKALRIWEVSIADKKYRVVLEKDTLNIFVNGVLREEEGEFVDGGTDTIWEQDDNRFSLSARTGDNTREGLVHSLTVNGQKIVEISITETN